MVVWFSTIASSCIVQLYTADGTTIKIALAALGVVGSGLGLWYCNRRNNKGDKK